LATTLTGGGGGDWPTTESKNSRKSHSREKETCGETTTENNVTHEGAIAEEKDKRESNSRGVVSNRGESKQRRRNEKQ
jgi:hypothetical protein